MSVEQVLALNVSKQTLKHQQMTTRLTSITSKVTRTPDTTSPAVEEIIKTNDIVVFSSYGCPYCAMVDREFENEGLDALVVEADYATRVRLKGKTAQRCDFNIATHNLLQCLDENVKRVFICCAYVVCAYSSCSSVPQVCCTARMLDHALCLEGLA